MTNIVPVSLGCGSAKLIRETMCRHVCGFCWVEIVCISCLALVTGIGLSSMDQPGKRKVSAVWGHFDLIMENKVNDLYVRVSTSDYISLCCSNFFLEDI